MSRRIISPMTHEFAVNLNFNCGGLNPWIAADHLVKRGGGSVLVEAVDLDHLEADSADVKLYAQDSALQPPEGGKTLAGSRVDHEKIREFRIRVTANDGLGERKVNFHIRPRWANLEAETKHGTTTTISVPDQLANNHTDAVNVRCNGSNIPMADYHDLLLDAADALDINTDYFAEYHPTSNIQDAARYIRVDTDAAGPIHGRAGPIVQLAHVLENDRSGYRKLVQNDDDEAGRNSPGFYHTATLGPERVQEVWPNHNLPVEIKHYYKGDALDRPKSDPLRHPKLEVSYQTSRWNETLYYNDETIQQIQTELDEKLFSILAESGLDLRGGEGSPYVADHYFDADNGLTEASIVSLNLTEIKHEQENVVVRHLADGLSPIEGEALGQLVTDGGTVSPSDISDAHDRHIDAVYRALDRMDDLVDREYGRVNLKSTHVAELVHTAVDSAKKSVERATAATAEALDAADRGLDEKTSAFIAWCEAHDVNFSEKDDSVTVNLGEVDADSRREAKRRVKRLLREGFNLWQDMNRDPIKFRIGRWTAQAHVLTNESKLRSVDTHERQRVGLGGKNWQEITS